jgi:hypothetical protein
MPDARHLPMSQPTLGLAGDDAGERDHRAQAVEPGACVGWRRVRGNARYAHRCYCLRLCRRLPRHAPAGTPILVGGERTVTIGRVSMDMLCADD